MGTQAQTTPFTLDNMGRYLCNTLTEAIDSTKASVSGRTRPFDVVIIGGGTFGAAMAAHLFENDPTHSRRILVLEQGPFVLPEHVQNTPFPGAEPAMRVPWDSHPDLNYAGLLFALGGRSLTWGGWSPEMLDEEFKNWPPSVVADLKASYFRQAGLEIGSLDTNDFLYGRLHTALRRQLANGIGSAPHAIPLAALPDHPSVRYAGMLAEGDLAMTAGATTSGGSSGTGSLAVADGTLQRMLGFAASDTTTRAAMLNLLKLEAPLAVQSRGEPGFFPTNKYSAVQELIRAAREAARETGGTDANFDARKRLMVVPQVPVLDIITETQADNWVRVTAVRAVDRDGQVYDIPLRTPADGGQGVAIIALGTIESTRLSLNTFQSSLAGRAAQRMGQNLVAHLRSNLTIRIPVSSLAALPAASQTSLQASALFAKGRVKIDGENRFFHLQITACGLNKAGVSSEAELFQKIPDSDQVSTMIAATDTHAVITLRGIGEMTPKNADSFIRLSPTRREGNRPAAEVTLANVKKQASTTPQSLIDQQTWDAMDALADEVSLILADGKAFEILAAGRWIAVAGGVPVAGVKAALPYQKRRDDLGTTHHDAGTMWMGDDPATSVTNAFGRIHDTANCYVNSPALFPSLGSPNPMLTGIALTRRTGEMLSASVLPRAPVRDAGAAGFTALFDGTVATRKKWQLAPRSSPVPNNVQGFGFSDGELISYGKSDDFALLYYAAQTFANFHLRLQFKVLDAANPNSGVFVRFRDPQALLPAALLASPRAVGTKIDKNPAWTAVISGFEVQIDDRAAAGPFTQRTGGLYLIDAVAQQYQAGPAARENVWMQYDIVATGNRFEVTLTDTETGETKRTALYDNPDASRGLPGYVGIQSYPGSPVAFRDIWIK